MSEMKTLLGKQIILLFFIVAFAWLVGYLLNAISLVIILSLLLFLFWHAIQFKKLFYWLINRSNVDIPDHIGPWYPIFEYLYRWRKKTKQNKKELLSVINEFRMSTEALADAVVVLGYANSIIWCNRASRKLMGLNRSKDTSKRIGQLIRMPKFIQFLEKGNFEDALTIQSPINAEIILNIQITPYLKSQKLLVCRDVSEIHKLERIRQDFVSNVSHELRTPLTVINGYLEVLDQNTSVSPQQLKQMIHEMTSQSNRMQHIVDELLYLAKMEHGLKQKSLQAIDMHAMLAQLKQEAEALSGDKKHQISVTINAEESLLASFNDIHKIFSNLVFNAVRYTPEGGKIDLNWYVKDKKGCFSVSDTGLGISSEDIPRITERFYRVDRGRDRDCGGTGLGLSIVKHTLEGYQAKLIVKSELDVGSQFTCCFKKDWLQ